MYVMKDELQIGGKIYVSSRRLSEKYGYSIDHISRLCRKGRINGKLVSRAWFVDENDFLAYTKTNRKNTSEGSKDTEQKHDDTRVSEDFVPTVEPTEKNIKEKVKTNFVSLVVSPYFDRIRRAAIFLLILSSIGTVFAAYHPNTRDSFEGNVARIADIISHGIASTGVLNFPRAYVGNDTIAAVGAQENFLEFSAIRVYEGISDATENTKSATLNFGKKIKKTILSWFDIGDTNSVLISVAETPKESIPPSPQKETIIREKITERVVERVKEPTTFLVQSSGVSKEEIERLLEESGNAIKQELYRVAGNSNGAPYIPIVSNFSPIALSQKIDQLSGVTISNATISGSTFSGTVSGYLPLSGGTLTGVLALSATTTSSNGFDLADGCFAVNGACITGGGSGTPGGLDTQVQFNSGGSFEGDTNFIWDNINKRLGIGTTSPYATLSVAGEIVGTYFTATTTANNTFPNLVATNSTTTNATSTNFYSSLLIAGDATTTNLFSTTASSTNLFTSNFSLANLTGFLKATAGSVATALVDLATDITGTLGVGNGGTGWAAIQSGDT